MILKHGIVSDYQMNPNPMTPEKIESIAEKWEKPIVDDFNADNEHLRKCIAALIRLNDSDSLAPHGIGGHARSLLAACYHRLALTELDESHKAELEVAKRVQGHLADHAKCLSEELAARDAEIERLKDTQRQMGIIMAIVSPKEDFTEKNAYIHAVESYAADTLQLDLECERLRAQLAETKAKLAEAEKEVDKWTHEANARFSSWEKAELDLQVAQKHYDKQSAQLLAQQDLNAKLREALTEIKFKRPFPADNTDVYDWMDQAGKLIDYALALPFDQTLLERICTVLDKAFQNVTILNLADEISALLAELRPQ